MVVTAIASGAAMNSFRPIILQVLGMSLGATLVCAASPPVAKPELCLQPVVGSTVEEPQEITSKNGVLNVTLRMRRDVDANGRTRYCYVSEDGKISPTLRISPGDTLVVELKNEVTPIADGAHDMKMKQHVAQLNACAGGMMIEGATNLHFHGMVIPPTCHQDDTLRTIIAPGDPPFEYRIHIPEDTPPGLYWYHPHPHGFSKAQVLGGACGALIVEGMDQAVPQVRGLREQVLVIRDLDLMHPQADPVRSDAMPPPIVLRDAEGDILNAGFDGGKPAKDLSVNYVPVPFPEYSPATLQVPADESQFWRVLNASAITYVDLQLLFKDRPQMLGVVALDGAPLNQQAPGTTRILWYSHITLPPGARAEFIMKTPAVGMQGSLVTRMVDTGPAGENDPTRPLMTIVGARNSYESISGKTVRAENGGRPNDSAATEKQKRLPWLGDLKPVRERKLYFYEEPENPNDPNSPTKFYITVDGEANRVFDMAAATPNMTVRQGDVEDWVIENRTRELHAFHIHQTHFLLTGWNGVPLQEPYLRDIVNVPYWDGVSPVYPSVKLRMDFRDAAIAGTFVYHCHLLEHEDGGMMGTIRVLGPDSQQEVSKQQIDRGNHHN